MYNSDLRLTPVNSEMPALSMYRRVVQQFLDSGEAVTAVEGRQSLQTIYVGLRRAVSDMGLSEALAVRRCKGQAILKRLR